MMLAAIIPVLMSRDVAASLAFYRKLGFAVDFTDLADGPRYAGISRDGVALHLQWQDPSHWQPGQDRPVYRFMVQDADEAYADLIARDALAAPNYSQWREPADTPWGTYEFHLRDPDGNGLQFVGLNSASG
jgi:catechol 2,3-dioxygenase-like lactoylglutathione lyase family enzyme